VALVVSSGDLALVLALATALASQQRRHEVVRAWREPRALLPDALLPCKVKQPHREAHTSQHTHHTN
jgi:hypothetical protein